MPEVDFAWDPVKSDENLVRRRFDFAFAADIFRGATVETADTRRDYGEVRVRAIGRNEGRVLMVVYTDRDGVRRIISARAANRKERAAWLRQSSE